MISCKRCTETKHLIKRGRIRSQQRYYCKTCQYHFILGGRRQDKGYPPEAKALAVLLYGTMKSSYGMIARLLGRPVNASIYGLKRRVLKYLNLLSLKTSQPLSSMRCGTLFNQKKGLDLATIRRLYDKVKHRSARYFTDAWEVYQKVLPREQHTVGKAYTTAIEQDNANTRHFLARMTRRTKVVSKSAAMVDLSLRIQYHLAMPENYRLWQAKIMGIF